MTEELIKCQLSNNVICIFICRDYILCNQNYSTTFVEFALEVFKNTGQAIITFENLQ